MEIIAGNLEKQKARGRRAFLGDSVEEPRLACQTSKVGEVVVRGVI